MIGVSVFKSTKVDHYIAFQTGGSLSNDHSDATAFSSDFMETKPIESRFAAPAYVWLIQLFGAYAAYITGKD